MNEQNERISSLIASGVAPLDALKAVQATDAIAAARKAVAGRRVLGEVSFTETRNADGSLDISNVEIS